MRGQEKCDLLIQVNA